MPKDFGKNNIRTTVESVQPFTNCGGLSERGLKPYCALTLYHERLSFLPCSMVGVGPLLHSYLHGGQQVRMTID